MNTIYITNNLKQHNGFVFNYTQANKFLQAFREDYFNVITIENSKEVALKDLRFVMHFTRILNKQGKVLSIGEQNPELSKLLVQLGLHQNKQNTSQFNKNLPKIEAPKLEKLAIGFKTQQSSQQEQIDQNELLQNQGINISKKKAQKCQDKPRSCANCSCGRKQMEQTSKLSKQELVQSINQGKIVSGCGKCSMGDSFRCGSCPYKGLPKFKPGDKLNIVEEGNVVVEQAPATVSKGKVKIQL